MPQHLPHNSAPGPTANRLEAHAQALELQDLVIGIQEQFRVPHEPARRDVLHQDKGRAAQVSVLQMKGDLVRRQRHLPPPLDDLELDQDELAMRERDQAVRDTQTDPRLNPGEMAVW